MTFSSSRPAAELAILPNWLGDLVMALPALAAQRARGPLLALGPPAALSLLEDAGLVDEGLALERGASLPAKLHVAREAARRDPARAIAYPPSLRAGLLAALSRAPERRGLPGERGRGLLLDAHRGEGFGERTTHLADQWLGLARGDRQLPAGEARPALDPGPVGRAAWNALRREAGVGARYLVLAPGATYGPTKRWPEGQWLALAAALGGRAELVWSGGPAPEERELCARLAAEGGGHDLSGRATLPALAAMLAGAVGFVGNDSGPMHLAAAVGTPTVGIFGSTSPAWTAPRGRAATTVGPHPVHCTPCFSPTCPYDLECLRGTGVDQVVAALKAVTREAAP